jgi:hypothetical protein
MPPDAADAACCLIRIKRGIKRGSKLGSKRDSKRPLDIARDLYSGKSSNASPTAATASERIT